MNKNSTSTTLTSTPSHHYRTSEAPAKITLAKIRQFARSYTFVNTRVVSLGGVVAN
ncbi:MAG: hypothetical protein NC212_09390 [Staphylococcus sp.]|nr:hypothetical protein [Staphylococcus sp.]